MQRELSMAGFRITLEEWSQFDEASRQQLLETFDANNADELTVDPPYDQYELIFD